MRSQSRPARILLLVVGVLILAFAAYTVAVRMAGGSRLETARSLYEAGHTEKAYRLFEAIHDRNPQGSAGQESLYYMCLIGKGTPAERIECWERFLDGGAGGEKRAEGMLQMAALLHSNGEDARAIGTCREVIRGAPGDALTVRAMHQLATLYRDAGELGDARDLLRSILEEHPDDPRVAQIQKELGDVGVEMLLSRRIYSPMSMEYVVQQGDSLEKIARKFNTTVELLKASNDRGDGVIRYNDRLKVVKADFTILIDKSQCTLSLFADGELLKLYSVGTGKDNVTPVGTFKITNKITEPVWYRPGGGEIPYGDPENLLGSRWMGIDSPGYGIHGTWEPDTVGKQSSAGCVRLLNEDVEELFMIVPLGTPVTIVD